MPAPALNFPVTANLDDFKKKMNDVSSHVGTVSRQVLKQFADVNAQIGGPIAANMAANVTRAALTMAARFALVVGAAKLVGDAIQETRDRIKEMADVAEKASQAGVSAEFFQSFMAGAKGAEDRVESFESALQSAFQATKPLLNPDWSVWDQGLQKVSAVEKTMLDARELFTVGQNFSGVELFRSATNQDERIKAVLLYMQQLKNIGQELVALDIGEKMFGARFTDQVRLGRESFDKMLRTIESGSRTNFVSNEAAKNAKELDDRLNDAYRTIAERMKPSWDDLATTALRIKGVWTEIIEAVAKYQATEIKGPALGSLPAIEGGNNPDPNYAATVNQQILNQARRRRGQRQEFAGGAAPSEASALDAMSRFFDYTGYEKPQSENVPLPRRRPDNIPQATGGAALSDRFETTADSIERRTAALIAETSSIGENTAARERARIAAQLTATAMQLNADAGKGENVVTEQQKKRIEEVAAAYEQAASALEKVRVAKDVAFGRNTALLTPEDVAIAQQLRGLYGDDVPKALASTEAQAIRTNNAMREVSSTISSQLSTSLVDVIDGTKSAGDAFRDFARIAVRAIEETIVKMMVVQPLMRALQGGFGGIFGGVGGGGTGFSLTGTGGLFAGGGYTGPGGRNEPAGVVHRGEVVWSQDDVRRHGGVGAVEALRRMGGYANGGVVYPGGESDCEKIDPTLELTP